MALPCLIAMPVPALKAFSMAVNRARWEESSKQHDKPDNPYGVHPWICTREHLASRIYLACSPIKSVLHCDYSCKNRPLVEKCWERITAHVQICVARTYSSTNAIPLLLSSQSWYAVCRPCAIWIMITCFLVWASSPFLSVLSFPVWTCYP